MIALAQRVANKEITTKEAAKKLGVSVQNWYQLKSDYARTIKKGAPGLTQMPKNERTKPLISDDIRKGVERLQREGMNSLQIARELRISITQVNKYWSKEEELAGVSEGDIPDADPQDEKAGHDDDII